MTRKFLIVTSFAIALATALWCSASADEGPWSGIFHDSEDLSMCINNPYQSNHDGNALVANRNCGRNDPGSRIYVQTWGDHLELVFSVAFGLNVPWGKCVDLRNSEQWDGNWITIYTCNHTDAQKWDWDGTSFHYHANPAYCMNVHSDGRLLLWHCLNHGNQKFVVSDKMIYWGKEESPRGSKGGGCIPFQDADGRTYECE
jgi:hypothetical protein